ncbi:RNA-binding, RBD [Glarea lozoyensis ATCC 20868]|uniref:RNA-binding, RBD n=1 Tax=Glarea lozoyensis (strain ATCC 20868 / MF5171) TaxID=1116229 RepID=S3CZX6_GLAL2|nr:RNA-binding, RBD [Glarea lozoyensis ATCC 20868]EPE31802.1 RNA-binding, RBD [Glarea lozoyensis ATCC 20868]
MGDSPTGSFRGGKPTNDAQNMRANDAHTQSIATDSDLRMSQQTIPAHMAQAASYNQQQSFPGHFASPLRPDAFSMGNIGAALPEVQYHNYHNTTEQQRQQVHNAPNYQMQGMTQFSGQQAQGSSIPSMPYSVPYQNQFPGMYSAQHATPQHVQSSPNSNGQFFQGQGYMGQLPQQQQIPPYFVSSAQYGHHGSQMYHSGVVPSGVRGTFADSRQLSPQVNDFSGGFPRAGSQGRAGSIASSVGHSSIVRGPPRKPRQTGHAIWIGNLPPQTELMALVFHVCKEAPGLESLFLISKSNCAFANFKDEPTCTAAQVKIHDSRFQSIRLVSRLRRSSVGSAAGIVAPTGPAALNPPSNPVVARTPSPDSADTSSKVPDQDGENEQRADESATVKDKYFIVKSLTVEDLELSVRNGIWATQSHNEQALNKAYQSTENVYLIFSANKSGEYFGYARMTSKINDDPAAAIEFAPKPQSVEDPDLPKAIATAATEFAPKGRIIDDSARGTIFWEVERDDEPDEEDDEQSTRSDPESETASKAWGKPFKIEWVSTMRLPFYRTRGLRNPWNSNREVKIARDGTELETSIGRRLVGLFHRLPSPTVPQTPDGVMPILGGYPQMRQY